MTTKPDTSVWADEPYKLLLLPDHDEEMKTKKHSAIKCASLMASAHNCMIRALNAVMLQGPYIPDASQKGYITQDVKDFVFYIWSWTQTVAHHHKTEETVMFPLLEKAANEEGIFTDPLHQHEEFHGGLKELEEYTAAHKANPDGYRWSEVKRIVDGFGETMCNHLGEEIGVILSLEKYDSDAVQKAWDDAEKVAKNAADLSLLYEVFPLVLGSSDKTYQGKDTFPEFPSVVLYALVYIFSRRHRGSWRYSPCDLWGKPVPLYVQPTAQ